MHQPERVLAFNDPLHDSSFCMYDDESIIHIESERYTRQKYEFINPILTFCELFPERVQDFSLVAFEESDYAVARFIRKLLDLKARSGARPADAVELSPPYAVDYLAEHFKFPPATNSTAAVARFVTHLQRDDVRIFFCGHHAAHAANAFFSSGFPRALTITLDGGGFDYELDGAGRNITRASENRATRRIYGGVYRCSANRCEPLYQLTDLSFGLAWARMVGEIFRLADGEEGTVMAMAALGDPSRFCNALEEPWL